MRSSSFLQDHQQYKPMAPINPISQTIGEVLANQTEDQLWPRDGLVVRVDSAIMHY
jgi:hypothetical protein